MIKIEKVKNDFTGVEIDFVDESSIAVATIGMRNAKNSWNKSDSKFDENGAYKLGPNDLKLATTLSQAGPVHGKLVRQIFVAANITAPLYWWKEFDTYKVGTVANSTSTMHKLTSRDITMEDVSCDKCLPQAKICLDYTIAVCNDLRKKYLEATENHDPKAKDYWYSLIQTLPSSYNQTRTVTMNYEVLSNIYEYRKTHKLDEWHEFCDWIETLPYANELIVRGKKQEQKVEAKPKEQACIEKIVQTQKDVTENNQDYENAKQKRQNQEFTWGQR